MATAPLPTEPLLPESDAEIDAELEAMRNDPRLAKYRAVLPDYEFDALAAWCLGFFPFQRDWLLEDADLAICNKSRQIGTSHTTAAVGVLWGAFHGEMTTIISIGKDEAQEVLEKCRAHVDILQKLGSKCAATLKSNADEIVFASGGRIKALPSSGGRSFSGNVFLDEYAYQQHATKVWDAAAPVALLGFKIRVVSTPNGIGNEFYDLWELATNPDRQTEASTPWKAHEIPIELAISQGYPVDIAKCWGLAKNDKRLFAQMFNCSFLDNVLQYIPFEIIESCQTDEILEAPATGEFYAGLDIGREVDLSCLIVIHKQRAYKRVVHVECMKRTDSDGLEAMIARAFERYKLRRLCIDSTGLGTFPVDRVKKQWSEKIEVSHRRPRVEGIVFGPLSKETLATGLYTAMTDTLVVLPLSDRELPTRVGIDDRKGLEPPRQYTVNELGTAKKLKRELGSIQRVITTAGNVQYKTPRTADGHADRAWALMLALHASTGTNPMIDALQARMYGGQG